MLLIAVSIITGAPRSSAGFASAISDPFEVVSGPPDALKSTFTAEPATARADGVASIDLTLVARDRLDNLAEGFATTFTASGSDNSLSPAESVTTDADGVARYTPTMPTIVEFLRLESS